MRSKTVKNYLLVCGVAAHVAGILAVVTLAIVYSDRNFGEVSDRSFGELVGKFQQRFGNDHPAVVAVITRTAGTLGLPTAKPNEWIELPTFPGPGYWPAQGAVNSGLKALSYDERGAPKQAKPGIELPSGVTRTIVVSDEKSLLTALKNAAAGDAIELRPGSYHLKGQRVVIGGSGTPNAPIYVRARRVGTVRIEMDTLEGFFVNKPYWVFENLSIRGVCTSDSRCEHAFHVVGNGVGTVLRNNELIDFNAALKVNGLRAKKPEQHPDFGLVQNNTIYNTRPRNTGNPTTPLNINTANGWVVSSNFIADFAKGKSDRISYAAFMKGNSSNGVFERNLVVCHWKLPMDGGIRIGLSFGGGGTGKQFCRWGDCRAEHTAGIMRNNIITRCPADVGIYLNRSARTQIYGNLLLNNKGIDVRFSSSSASIHNNIIDGRILDREGGKHTSDNNLMSSDCSVLSLWFGDCSVARFYRDSASGDFQLIDIDAILDRGSQDMQAGTDFCGNHRDHLPDIGPIEYGINSTCLADLTSAPPAEDPIAVD